MGIALGVGIRFRTKLGLIIQRNITRNIMRIGKKLKAKISKQEYMDVSVSNLKQVADRLFSLFIINRDKGVCVTCGSKKNIGCGHYVRRDCVQLRFNEQNAHAQCFACNVKRKGNYPVYAVKMMKMYGDDILYKLDELSKIKVADSRKLYTDIISLYSDTYLDES